jgi:uncharacterized protein YndB with AHSA1/START domain
LFKCSEAADARVDTIPEEAMAGEKRYVGASVRARIAAPSERLWAIVADPSRHPEVAGSGEPQETHLVTEGPLAVGSRFESRQKWMGMKYTSHSEVTALQEPRLLRWRVDKTIDWEFRFEPLDGEAATRVTHSYRWGIGLPAILGWLLGPLLGWRQRQMIRTMPDSLRNLARLAGAPEPTELEISREAPRLE